MAAGVSGLYPASLSSASISSRSPALKNTAIVEWWAARDRKLSLSGTAVRPAIRVMITVWDTSGRVSSAPRLAAAPLKELTPGQTS